MITNRRPTGYQLAAMVIGLLLPAACTPSSEAAHSPEADKKERMDPPFSDEEFRENLSLLGSEHGDYRNTVQWFLDQGKVAGPFLLDAIQEEGATFLQKGRIIQVLGELREDAAVPLLAKYLQSGQMSWESAQALGKIGSEEAGEALIRGLWNERLEVVKESAKALGKIPSEAAAAALTGQLLHQDPSVRFYAVRSLIRINPPGLSETLRQHLSREEDAEVRRLIREFIE